MSPVHLQSAAVLDIVEAAEHYDEQRPGLGLELVLEVDAAIDRASEYPEMYEAKEQGARRILVRRFPYSVYCLIEDHGLEIFAVLHQHLRRTGLLRQQTERPGQASAAAPC